MGFLVVSYRIYIYVYIFCENFPWILLAKRKNDKNNIENGQETDRRVRFNRESWTGLKGKNVKI